MLGESFYVDKDSIENVNKERLQGPATGWPAVPSRSRRLEVVSIDYDNRQEPDGIAS